MIPKYNAEKYDVAVIGGGHAGIEAALAAARLTRTMETRQQIMASIDSAFMADVRRGRYAANAA